MLLLNVTCFPQNEVTHTHFVSIHCKPQSENYHGYRDAVCKYHREHATPRIELLEETVPLVEDADADEAAVVDGGEHGDGDGDGYGYLDIEDSELGWTCS